MWDANGERTANLELTEGLVVEGFGDVPIPLRQPRRARHLPIWLRKMGRIGDCPYHLTGLCVPPTGTAPSSEVWALVGVPPVSPRASSSGWIVGARPAKFRYISK